MVNEVVDLIDRLEWLRKQIDTLEDRLRGVGGMADVISAGRGLDEKLIELEMMLFDLHLTGGNAGQDTIRWPRRLYAKLNSLAGYIGGNDFRPTDQQMEVLGLYRGQLLQYQEMMERLKETEITSFNSLLAEKGIEGLIIR
jgi:hypothetical protein